MKKNKKARTESPFKNHSQFEKEIKAFANKYKTIVVNQAKRTSDYFEMTCYNYIIRFYELHGYDVTVQNLQSGKYRYKCSPSGIQSNFSYFLVSKKIGSSKKSFEIQHNLAVQSSHDTEIFTTPDIAIIKKNKIEYSKELHSTRKVNIAWTRLNSNRPSFTIDTGHNHHFHYEFNRVPTAQETGASYSRNGADISKL